MAEIPYIFRGGESDRSKWPSLDDLAEDAQNDRPRYFLVTCCFQIVAAYDSTYRHTLLLPPIGDAVTLDFPTAAGVASDVASMIGEGGALEGFEGTDLAVWRGDQVVA